MIKHAFAVLTALAALQSVTYAQSEFDLIKLTPGSAPSTMRGTITAMSPVEVTIDQPQKGEIKVPVNTISFIQFLDEPNELTRARGHVTRGAYEEAAKEIADVTLPEGGRADVAQDFAFYKALIAARLAMSGTGDPLAAGKLLLAFLTEGKGNYHFLEANEVLGDLLTSMGRYEAAQTYYSTLGKAPWPDYKVRAALSVGRSLEAQKKFAEASAEYDKVIAAGASIEGAALHVWSAMIGKGNCLTIAGKPAEALPVLQQVVAKADPEAAELYARAYNAMGSAHKALKQPKEALLSYLKVHVMYSAYAEPHAEALANLSVLWNEVNRADYAEQAAELLKERYASSRWAKLVK